jgi:protein-glutamine gamma-glutamyltransferase
MKTPPYLLGATLLFWGWQTGLLIGAVPMAILLEASQFIRARWEFSAADLKRIWNLCIVLFFGLGFILYSAEDDTARFPLKFAQWLPFTFFPIILAQIYGSSEKISLLVFSWFLRRTPEKPLAKKSLNISFHYFGVCLLGASATSLGNQFFYLGIVVLIGVALMTIRPLRLPQPIWILLIAAVGLAGHIGHQQLRALHATVEGTLARIFVRLFSRENNLDESRTAIGRIGKIQLSGKIVLRVRLESPGGAPALLRDASYDVYKNGIWRSSQNEFVTVFAEATNDVTVLQPLQAPGKSNSAVRIAGYLRRGQGQLSLPHGAYELNDFPAVLKTNRLGTAKVEAGPGLLNFLVHYGPRSSINAPPVDADVDIPLKEKSTIAQVASELNLAAKSEQEKIDTIRRFFQDKFTYSLQITRNHIDRSRQKTALGQFLTAARSGHCEYFATATVLLLRKAGIPARYATGYVVDEFERKGKTYLVRERDAHAWVLVYRKDKGIWEEFDTTPASAERAEASKVSPWESLSDFFSNLKFQFSKWRWGKTTYTTYLKWLLIPLVLVLVWRIFSNKRRRRNKASDGNPGVKIIWPGLDSEFYLLEERLTAAGLARFPNEPLNQWQKRLSSSVPQPEHLDPIFSIHSRLRFDPNGVTPEEREILKSDVKQWLETFDPKKSEHDIQ